MSGTRKHRRWSIVKQGCLVVGLAVMAAGLGVGTASASPRDDATADAFVSWAASAGHPVTAAACYSADNQVTCYGTAQDGSAFGATATLPDLHWVPLSPGATGSPTTSTAPPPGAPDRADNDHLFTSGEISVPQGAQGEVSIVVTGPTQDNSTVPLIVRNGTAAAVTRIEVTGTARDATGQLVATGASQGFNPYRVEPGEWSMGYVYFDTDALPGGEAFEFSVSFAEADPFLGKVDLSVTEASHQGDRVVGIMTNDTDTAATSPVEVYVGCFDEGALVSVVTGFTDGFDDVVPGGTSSFSVDLYGTPCSSFAIAGSGFDF